MAVTRHSLTTQIALIGIAFGLVISGCGGNPPATLPPVDQQTRQAAPPPDTSALQTNDSNQSLPGWVIKDRVNVRALPNTTADVVVQLARGAEVRLLELADKWWKVQLADGRVAYIFEPLISQERYVDPLSRFKMEAGYFDRTLDIVAGVNGLDSETPAIAITVAEKWDTLGKPERASVADVAFRFWTECLKKSGYEPQKSRLILRNTKGKEIGSVIYEDGQPVVTLAE